MFIRTTQLVQIQVSRVDPTPSNAVVHTVNSIVHTVEAMVGLMRAQDRPAAEDYGNYRLNYLYRFYCVPVILGETPDGVTHLEYAVWETQASHTAGDPPVLTNTHSFLFSNKPGTDYAAVITRSIDEYLLRAALFADLASGNLPEQAKWVGDTRERRLRTDAPDTRYRVTRDVAANRPIKQPEVEALDGVVRQRT